MFVPGHAFRPPHQADHVGVVFVDQGHHAVHALGPGHDGVDDGLAFMDLEAGFHGGDVGGVQGQGDIGHHFLDGLDDPLHQFFAALAGRADIDVDEIHPGLGLFQGHFLEGFGVALLHRLTIDLGHHVQVFADSVKFVSSGDPLLNSGMKGRKPATAFSPVILRSFPNDYFRDFNRAGICDASRGPMVTFQSGSSSSRSPLMPAA